MSVSNDKPRELDEILRTVVGSGVHGIAIEGTDDHDEMGVFIEPPAHVVGLAPPLDHDVWRTQPEGARSGPGDVDLVRYSLRKYIRLAVKGNPTVLLPLYAEGGDVLTETRLGRELRELAPSIVSQQAGRRFLGYMHAQRERMEGRDKQNRLPKRPELVEAFGYDVKYASHALRLALQGLELIRTGRLTLPMPEPERKRVRAVKSGQVAREAVLASLRDLEYLLIDALDKRQGPLPERPDIATVGRWMEQAHARHWRTHLGRR